MTDLRVDGAARRLTFGSNAWMCEIGKGGMCAAADKREGDGCTPVGSFAIRAALVRPDRGMAPPARLPWRWLRPWDGWCDAPEAADYNRPVRHPFPYSAERLWREDPLYDAILVLGHNDDPPERGAGSAIFLHLRGSGPTEGCIAVDQEAMQFLLAAITPVDRIDITFGDPVPLG